MCSRPPQNVKFGIFTTYSRAVTAKKRTKERDARANFFCQSKSIALLPFSLASPPSLLKLPIIVSGCKPDPPLLRSPCCCCYNYYLLLFFLFTGLYFYVDTYRHSSGDNAKLTFALPRNKSSYCLTFYYYMYGSGMETLNVYSGNNKIFAKSGNQGSYWKRAIRTVYLSDMVNV